MREVPGYPQPPPRRPPWAGCSAAWSWSGWPGGWNLGGCSASAARVRRRRNLAIWNGPALTTGEWLYLGLFVAAGIPGIGFLTGQLRTHINKAPQRQGRSP